MLNLTNLLTGNIPPIKPPRGRVHRLEHTQNSGNRFATSAKDLIDKEVQDTLSNARWWWSVKQVATAIGRSNTGAATSLERWELEGAVEKRLEGKRRMYRWKTPD